MFGFEFYYIIAKGLKGLKIFEFSHNEVYKRSEIGDYNYVYEITIKRYLYPKEDINEPSYLEFTSFQFDSWTSKTLNGLAKKIFPTIFNEDPLEGYNWE